MGTPIVELPIIRMSEKKKKREKKKNIPKRIPHYKNAKKERQYDMICLVYTYPDLCTVYIQIAFIIYK